MADSVGSFLLSYSWIAIVLLLLAGYKWVLRIFGVVIIPDDKIGSVTIKWRIFGANRRLPGGAIFALNNEAGKQANTLPPGLHMGFWPWQYQVDFIDFTPVRDGYVGLVEAHDGKPTSGGRVLGKHVECNAFQDAHAFLANGGERGPQITVIPPGLYRINKSLFSIVEVPAKEVSDSMIGIATVKDGQSLQTGEIAGPEIPGHSMFQNGQAFIDNGGFKGPQSQVVLPGRYYFNPRFVTIEEKKMWEVPIAHAGVVISYVGVAGEDVTGAEFTHGNIVKKGQKGVWEEPLDPGKYPINPFTHFVENVPTANTVLNWATGKTEAHKLDEKLSTITVRSKDGYTFNLDVSQIIHIPRNEAPKVIARFGSVNNLVTQVLEPMIGNYFRNAAQNSDVMEFLSERTTRQEEAKSAIAKALSEYNVVAVDTLIGDINPPPELMKTLTDRKLAEQEKLTYDAQKLTEDTRKQLEEATAIADTQKDVVAARRDVLVAGSKAEATVKTAKGAAEAVEIAATAEAMRLRTIGEAEAGKTSAVGGAEAEVIRKKIESMESGNYAGVEIARALAQSGQKLVPEIIAGGEAGGANSIMSVLLANLVMDNMHSKVHNGAPVGTLEATMNVEKDKSAGETNKV